MGRFVIYGAGAIGGIVGGMLAQAGSGVVLIGRQAHVEAITQNGLRLVTPAGILPVRLAAVTAPDQIAFQPDDVVFLCMKGQDTEGALRDLKRVVADVPVFCFQNGVRNEAIAAGYYRRVYGVMVSIGGAYLTPGEVTVRRDPPGSVIMGCYPNGQDGVVLSVAGHMRSAGFRVAVTSDVMPYKWGKLIGNLGNAIAAATDGHDPDGRIATAVREEARALLRQAGIRWVTQEDARREFPELATPDRAAVRTRELNSTWQSLQRGEGTVETDFLNGEIVRLAQRLGAQAPLNAALLRIAQEMAANGDKPGKYTPEQLAAALGLES